MKKRSATILAAYLMAGSLLEFAAFKLEKGWSVTAAWLWLFTGLAVLGFFVFESLYMLAGDIKEKRFTLVFLFAALNALLLFFIGNISFSDVNADACQQLAAGLDSFKKADLNYTGKAFLGYPNRQYVLAALPALLFGRKIWTLQAGFGLLFIIAVNLLVNELRRYLREKELREEYAYVAGFAFPVFPFITEYYMNFEQAFTPVALSAVLCALYLRLCRKPDVFTFVALSWTGCFLSGSYTPALALLGLFALFLILRIIYYLLNGTPFLSELPLLCTGLIINAGCFFIAGFKSRADRVGETREKGKILKTAFDAWKDFFGDKNVAFFGVFGAVVIIYMLLSLLLRLKIYDFAVSVWVLGVVFASEYMKGYTSYDKAWMLQRNMIVIPVLITSVFTAFVRFLKKHGIEIKQFVLWTVIAAFLFIGIGNFMKPHRSFAYFKYVQPMKYLISDIYDSLEEYGLKETDSFAVVMYTDNSLQSNLRDYASFFFPNAKIYSESGNAFDENIQVSYEEGLVVFAFAEDERLSELEAPAYECSAFDALTAAPQKYSEHKNIRYDRKNSWYRKVFKK